MCNTKIWGTAYGITGDIIMSLPMLTYFEKKYPDSYKYFVIEKKVGHMGQFFLNHPLIDKIRITQEWNGFGKEDYALARECDFVCTMDGWEHKPVDWYNHRGCIEETARIAGIDDLLEVLEPSELYPKLYKWFDAGHEDPFYNSYSKQNSMLLSRHSNDNIISIFPFATGNGNIARTPNVKWWNELIYEINGMGYRVWQFGSQSDPELDGVTYFNTKTFFEQVKISLSTKMTIGTDSGNMWVMGAYSHPALHLMTNWLPLHVQNYGALTPANRNGDTVFTPGGANNINHDEVLSFVERKMNASTTDR